MTDRKWQQNQNEISFRRRQIFFKALCIVLRFRHVDCLTLLSSQFGHCRLQTEMCSQCPLRRTAFLYRSPLSANASFVSTVQSIFDRAAVHFSSFEMTSCTSPIVFGFQGQKGPTLDQGKLTPYISVWRRKEVGMHTFEVAELEEAIAIIYLAAASGFSCAENYY